MQLAGCRAVWKGLVVTIVCCGCSSLGQRDAALADGGALQPAVNGPGTGVEAVSFEQAQPAADPLTLSDFSPDNFAQTLKQLTGQGPDPTLARQWHQDAEARYTRAIATRQQNPQESQAAFLAAAESYAVAVDRWPDSTLEHEALFRLGECYFFADHYSDAEEAFELLLKKYPNSKHMDRLQPFRFAIAQYWLDEANQQAFYEVNLTDESRPTRDTFGHAVRVLDRIRLDDPTGKLADDATLALGNAFFQRGKYLRADEYYTDLRKTFPSSEHQFTAHFLGLKAKLMSYQGPDYAANALDDAAKLLTQIKRQFPGDVETEREYLARAQAEVRYLQAQREWVLGEQYYRRSEYGAARFHYQALLEDYSDTPFEDRARQRMQETGGLPNHPPQRLSWLVNLFPERGAAEPIITNSSVTTLR